MAKKLVLTSTSSRRQELLQQIGISFSVRIATTNESHITTTVPEEKVIQLATLKGRNVPLQSEDEVILAADTVVSFRQKIFEKPKSKTEAYAMISSLSGNIHDVYTGVFIRSATKERRFYERTTVEFWPLTEKEITWYINTKEPYDKAGAYGIQSLGALFVKRITGNYYNVVGLPISTVVRALKEFDVTLTN